MKTLLRWAAIAIGGWLVFILLAVIVGLLLREDVEAQSILHLRLNGEIPESPGGELAGLFEDEPPTLLAIARGIRRAAKDERIVGLAIEVKHPQLGIAQLQEIEA